MVKTLIRLWTVRAAMVAFFIGFFGVVLTGKGKVYRTGPTIADRLGLGEYTGSIFFISMVLVVGSIVVVSVLSDDGEQAKAE